MKKTFEKNTYKYLTKYQKDAINQVEVKDMEECLRRGMDAQFIWFYDTLLSIFQEGHVVLNEWQMEVLMYPMKKWGPLAGMVFYEMRQLKNEQDKTKA